MLPRFNTICKILTLFCLLILGIIARAFTRATKQATPVTHFKPDLIFIHSIYYHKISRTLGKNAITIIATGNPDWIPILNLIATNTSGFQDSPKQLQITVSPNLCKYTTFIGQTNVLSNLKSIKIGTDGSKMVEVPYLEPAMYIKNPVVFCITPQVGARNWEIFLTQIQITEKYGAHLHVYFISAIRKFHDLLSHHANQNNPHISFQPWILPPESIQSQTDLFSQTASSTDCLIRFKESAQFIGNIDLEDILIPNGHTSYYNEFNFEIGGEWLHNSLAYPRFYYSFLNGSKILRASRKVEIDSGAIFIRPDHYNITISYWNSAGEYISQFLVTEEMGIDAKNVLVNEVIRITPGNENEETTHDGTVKLVDLNYSEVHSSYSSGCSKSKEDCINVKSCESKALNEIFGKDAVILIATMNQRTVPEFRDLDLKFSIIATNYSMTRWIRPLKMEISNHNDPCDYTTVILSANVMRNMSRLEIQGSLTHWSDPISSEIKFVEPMRYIKNPVVFCINPIIAGENLKMLLAQVNTAKRFGAHLHIYVISVVENFYKLLKTISSSNENISISPWPSIKFPQTNHPIGNGNWDQFEFRTQTAASTDCLIRYKEAAQFITNLDLEDVMEPQSGLSYYEEFENLMGSYTGIIFGNRGLHVARPDYYNITKSYWTPKGLFVTKYARDGENRRVSTDRIKKISRSQIEKIYSTSSSVDVSNSSYYSIVLSKCQKTMSLAPRGTCTNPNLCDLPKTDPILCIHSDARYRSGVQMSPVTFHFNQEPFFNRNYRCFF